MSERTAEELAYRIIDARGCQEAIEYVKEYRRKILAEAADRAVSEASRWSIFPYYGYRDDMRRAVMGEDV